MSFIRLVIFGFIALTIIYFSVSIYSRSVRREWLEDEFDAQYPDGGEEGARDVYVEKGMVDYYSSIRPKLIWLVYVVPTVAVAVIVYVINAN